MVLIIGGYYYHFYFLLPNVTTKVKYFIGLFDLLIICIIAFHIIKLVLFLLHAFFVYKFAYHYYLQELETMLTKALANFQASAISSKYKLRQISKYCAFANILNFYMQEVSLAIRRAISANEYLVSPLFFYSAVSHFFLNLYLVTALYFLKLSIGDQIMIYCVLFCQVAFSLAILQPVVVLGNDLARPAFLLSRIQIHLNELRKTKYFVAFCCQKIKLLSFYERIHSVDAFRFTLGVFGKVTNASVVQVFF